MLRVCFPAQFVHLGAALLHSQVFFFCFGLDGQFQMLTNNGQLALREASSFTELQVAVEPVHKIA